MTRPRPVLAAPRDDHFVSASQVPLHGDLRRPGGAPSSRTRAYPSSVALPTPAEIGSLATSVARLLRDLPSPEHPEYDCRLSTIFGSPVHLVARKTERAGILRRMRTLFQRQPIRHNGIEYSFSRRLSWLLVYENSRIPDLQSASIDELHSVFPRDQWRVENGSNGIRSVVLGSSRGEVLMPRISGSALVALRFYGSPGPQGSLKVTVRSDRGEVASWRVDQGESFLFAQLMEPPRRHEPLRVEVTRERVGHAAETAPGHLSICFAAVFPV